MSAKAQYFAHATMVASFEFDRGIRYRLQDIETIFGSIVSGQANSVNVPDSAPPNIPRFTLNRGRKQLNFSQVSVQMDMDFTEKKQPAESAWPIVRKNFEDFWSGVCKYKDPGQITDLGIVLTVNTPMQKDTAEIGKLIFDRYCSAPKIGDVASTVLQIGFLDANAELFKNVSLAQYELRQGTIEGNAQKPQAIDLNTLPVVEIGLETKLDVNSRPITRKENAMTKDTGAHVIKALEEFLAGEGRQFYTWDIQ